MIVWNYDNVVSVTGGTVVAVNSGNGGDGDGDGDDGGGGGGSGGGDGGGGGGRTILDGRWRYAGKLCKNCRRSEVVVVPSRAVVYETLSGRSPPPPPTPHFRRGLRRSSRSFSRAPLQFNRKYFRDEFFFGFFCVVVLIAPPPPPSALPSVCVCPCGFFFPPRLVFFIVFVVYKTICYRERRTERKLPTKRSPKTSTQTNVANR